MNVTPFNVIWLCVFTMKLFGLIDVTWWIVAPATLLTCLDMWTYRK